MMIGMNTSNAKAAWNINHIQNESETITHSTNEIIDTFTVKYNQSNTHKLHTLKGYLCSECTKQLQCKAMDNAMTPTVDRCNFEGNGK